jgi:hypothetical protein
MKSEPNSMARELELVTLKIPDPSDSWYKYDFARHSALINAIFLT